MKNRGKDFEHQIEKGLKQIDDIEVYRIPDQMTYMTGSKNPCDYFVYKCPTLFAIECKSVHGNTLPFSNISEFQWSELLRMSRVTGIVACVLCWFVDRDCTKFIPIEVLEELRQSGKKSIRYDCEDVRVLDIPGKKRRILWDYDFELFFLSIPY